MPFLARAQALYERNDTVSTMIALVEGVKRYPHHTEAFRWMLDIYCEEIESTGLEEDLVTVVDACEDPEGVYAWVYKRLVRGGKDNFVRRLDRARRNAAKSQGRESIPLEALARARNISFEVRDVSESRAQPAPVQATVAEPARQVVAQVQALAVPAQALAYAEAGQGAFMMHRPAATAFHHGAMPPGTMTAPQMPAPGLARSATPRLGDSQGAMPSAPMSAPMRAKPFSWGGRGLPTRKGPSAPTGLSSTSVLGAALHAPENTSPSTLPGAADWDDIHPSLVMKARGGDATHQVPAPVEHVPQAPEPPMPSKAHSGISEFDEGRSGAWGHVSGELPTLKPRGRFESLDTDAIDTFEQKRRPRQARDVAWSTWSQERQAHSRRASARDDAQKPSRTGRRVAVLFAGILAVFLLALAGYRVVTLIQEQGQVTEPAAVTSQGGSTFLASDLDQAQRSLAALVADNPQDIASAVRLRWHQALYSWVHQAPLAAPPASIASMMHAPESAPENLRAWTLGASLLEALHKGKVEEAHAMLPALRLSAARNPDFTPALESWVTGELMLAKGDLTGAQTAYERAAVDGLVPAALGAADVCMRRGDAHCARRALTDMRRLVPEHPALALGEAALLMAEDVLGDPLRAEAPATQPIGTAELSALVQDRRASAWLAMVDPQYAGKNQVKVEHPHHPLLQVMRARTLLGKGQPEAAAQTLSSFRAPEVDPALRKAHLSLVSVGMTRAGRPDLALSQMEGPADTRPATLERFATEHPTQALSRAALLRHTGDFDQARTLLSSLLDHKEIGPEARVVALTMHLAEGNIEDVRRHMERLRDHRAALVAGAALDLYLGQPEAAHARLGPATASSLPDASAQPWMHDFELRVRLLTLSELGRHETLSRLLHQTRPGLALASRVQGERLGAKNLRAALTNAPTRLEDQVDIASSLLASGDMEGARSWAQRVVKKAPSHANAHQILAEVALANKEGRRAARHLVKAMQGRDIHSGLALSLAEAQLMSSNGLEALELLRGYLKEHPEDGRAMRLLGQAWRQTRRITRGIEDLERRVRRYDDKRSPEAAGEARLWLGRFYHGPDGNQRGGTELRKAHRLLGDRPDVMLELGRYNQERGDGSQALEFFRQSSDHPEAEPAAHLSLAKLALVRKQKSLAKMALGRYLTQAPKGKNAAWARRQMDLLPR